MTNLWYEITARVSPEQTEPVAAAMRAIAPGGITIEEPIDILGPEMGFRVRPGEPNLVRAWLPASELGAVLVADLRTAMEAFPAVELTAKPLYEQDWAVNWREFFGPVETGGRLVVVPTWIDYEPSTEQLVIRLDPGRAFGTGHHETTRLALRALERHVTSGCSVIDVGAGSGILSIGAALLGAGSVRAYEIDPVAAEVARENIAANGVSVDVVTGTLEVATDPAGVVVANISAAANIALAEAFARSLTAGGVLLLSGFLEEDVQRVGAAVEPWFEQRYVEVDRDWALVEYVRLHDPPSPG